MSTVNTLTSIPNENKVYYERVLLERLTPNLVFAKYGEKKPIPKNSGKSINFRRFDALEPVTEALAEGVTPSGKAISVSKVEATIEQMGDYVVTTDMIEMAAIDPVVEEMAEVLGEQAGQSIDKKVSSVVTAGTNVLYANGAATSAVAASNVMSADLIKKAVRSLRRDNAKPLEGGFYLGVIHPDVAFDIMNDPLWEDVSKYNGGKAIMEGEVGKLGGVRFIESSYAPVLLGAGASGADVYATMIIGKGAYAVADIENGSKPEMIIKPVGSGEDPLNQRASVGWKANLATARLNELAMIRVETGATA